MKFIGGASALLLTLVSAASPFRKADSSTVITKEVCVTRSGTVSQRHVPTTTITARTWATTYVTKTYTPTTTVTAKSSPPITSTSTVTTTDTATAPQTTDTTTVTSTTTTFSTSTTDITSTETDTIVTTVSTTSSVTSTVATSPGFIPIASNPTVIAAGGGMDNGRPVKRNYKPKPKPKPKGDCSKCTSPNKKCPRRHPEKVTCYENIDHYSVHTVTVTAHAKTVTVPASPPTTTVVTTTDTETTTVTPADATVTATTVATSESIVVTTETISTTTTTTSTSTSTIFDQVATQYAACAPNNVIDQVGPYVISEVAASTAFSSTDDNDMTNPVACCNLCQTFGNCAGWFIANPGGFYGCTLIPDDGTCDPNKQPWSFHTYDGAPSETFHLGNGPCGNGNYLGNSSS